MDKIEENQNELNNPIYDKRLILKFNHQQARREFETGILKMFLEVKEEADEKNINVSDYFEIIEGEDHVTLHIKCESLIEMGNITVS